MRPALIALVLVSACSPAATGGSSSALTASDTLTAAARGLPACTVPGADTSWREVTTPGFRFCVPSDWRPGTRLDRSASASGQWRGPQRDWVQWGIGPFKSTSSEGMILPYNNMKTGRAVIGGRPVEIDILELPDSHTSIARWDATATQPAAMLTGYASDAKLLERIRQITFTVRFDSIPNR